ncbi:hypothetical protein [Paenirhodobacter sp.]|uniref:hypothetical protein n=1 Tax=Paenirhodobacter sp. TaxID=1965326 RepID=UPI003B3C007F
MPIDQTDIVTLGKSRIGTAAQLGITAPGADVPVLNYQAFARDEGIRIDLPEGQATLTSFTMVWDVMTAPTGGFQALLQLGAENNSDADLFIRGNGGIGINGDYTGTVPADDWVRIALTVQDNGDGSSTLTKYIDGALVGTQTMPTARYTVDKGFLILTDDDGEVNTGYLAQFAVSAGVRDVAAMGGVGTPLADTLVTLGFAGNTPTVSAGGVDVMVTEETPVDPGDIGTVTIRDMLVSLSDEPVSYDLNDVFGANAHGFTVTNSNGEAVEATITDGVLTLGFNALGLSDLVVTAVNGAGQTVTDNVRVRVAGEGAYTIAIMPDTQDYTSNASISQTFFDMTQWLADNAASKGLNFVSHVGDITQWSAQSQFTMAKAAMDTLREAGVSFSVLPGNHDIGTNGSSDKRVTDTYNAAFSVGYMSGDPTFGGVYDQEPNRYDNNFHLWTAADGSEWITLNLEFGPRDDVLRWADEVLTQHAGRKAMVVTHSYNNYDSLHDPLGVVLEDEGAAYNYGLGNDPEGAWDGTEIWREVISSHANVVMTAGGHIFGDGAQTIVSYNDYGLPVFQFLVNYQDGVARETTGAGDAAQGGNGGNGAIRLVTVDPENDVIHTETYFTELDTYYTEPRGKAERDRDGLTGPYAGHQEDLPNAHLDRAAVAEADAGADQVVTGTSVTLSAAASTNPEGEAIRYTWTDEGGTVIASGMEAQVDLRAGVHDLTLSIETASGVVSTDDHRVIVKTDKVWLAETFDDGDAAGWTRPAAQKVVTQFSFDGSLEGGRIGTGTIEMQGAADKMAFGTTADFGLPDIGGAQANVMRLDALAPAEGLLVKPGVSGQITDYMLVYDIYIPSGAGDWTALLQTGTGDAEVFARSNGDGTAGMGISGTYAGALHYDAWNRIAVSLSSEGPNGEHHVLRKYINGVQQGSYHTVDSTLSDGSRWTIDGDKGFLLFADNDRETTPVYISSVTFVEGYDPGLLKGFGGADAGGPLSKARADDLGPFFVKGSATTDTTAPHEGALFDQSNQTDNLVVWKDGDWDDQIIEATLRSMDNDTMGLAFRHQDPANQYLLTLDAETNTRQLLRVQDGVTTVLATETGGYRFNDAFDLRINVVGGTIAVSMDGVALFGGAVTDSDPLGSGTVGLYSSGQKGAIFDDIVVRAADPEAVAGADLTLIDWDGDGIEFVDLDGSLSVGSDAAWSGRGVSAEGQATATAGRNDYTLTVDGTTDTVTVNLATGDRLIAADRFEDGDAAGWRIVDTTEIGTADWAVVDGRLVEQSGAYSRELVYKGANAADVWEKGWSPLGDGPYALHKGSYALWEGNTALTDYSIQTEVTAPTGAVGLMLNWQDANNYYKLEIDQRVGLTTLVKVVDGYETNLARSTTTYTPGEGFTLKAAVVDGKVQAWVDGLHLFADPIAVRDLPGGSAGVWSWGAKGAGFDDIAIVDLSDDFRFELHGSDGNDRLVGTDADELIFGGAGRLDTLTGGAGADRFVFGAETANGLRETTRITDFTPGEDRLDLGGAAINKSMVAGGSLLLWVGEDNDQIQLAGVSSLDGLAFV